MKEGRKGEEGKEGRGRKEGRKASAEVNQKTLAEVRGKNRFELSPLMESVIEEL